MAAKKPVPLDRMAKPQLLKAAQAMQKRITKLEAERADFDKVRQMIAAHGAVDELEPGEDTVSEAELIVLVKKLQASERKLLNQVAKLEAMPKPSPRPALNELTPNAVTVAVLEEAEALRSADEWIKDKMAEAAKLPGIGPCKPAFPWEPK